MNQQQHDPKIVPRYDAVNSLVIPGILSTTETNDGIPALGERVSESLELLDHLGAKSGYKTASQVRDAVGVFARIKQAAIIRVKPEDATQYLKALQGLGLLHRSYGRNDIELISREEDTLDTLANAYWATYDSSRDDTGYRQNGAIDEAAEQELGILLGYPPTAIKYYIQRLKNKNDELPRADAFEPPVDDTLHPFTRLSFSPDNWQEEIKLYSLPLMDAVKTLTPETYRVLTDLDKKVGGVVLENAVDTNRGDYVEDLYEEIEPTNSTGSLSL